MLVRVARPGYHGVELFFIISGFILAMPFAAHHLKGQRPVALGPYYLRRLTRLEPPYMLCMALLFVALVAFRGRDAGQLAPHLGASLLYLFSAEDRALAMASLEQVGLAEKAHVRADSLSGGQQQRVGIARALMQDPELILADEPVASLDPVLAHSIMQHLEKINTEDGVTVLCSLHFLDLVHRYAHRAIALNAGRIVFDGLPAEIDDVRFKQIYGQEAERVG